MLSKDWKVVRRYQTGGLAQLDAEDIEFDIYKHARELMELSGLKMLPEQELVRKCKRAACIYGDLLGRPALPPMDTQFANTHVPFVTFTNARLDRALLRVWELCSSSCADCTTGRAKSLRRVDHCWEALKTIIFLQNLLIRMKLMRKSLF